MPIGFLAAMAINVIFFVVGELLRPKPDFEDAEAIPFEESRLPSIDPEKKQPVVWGRLDLTAPHVMDVLEYNTVAIRKKIKTGMFSSTNVDVGHRYFFGVQLGLCAGPNVVLKRIYYDDVEVWSGTSDATATTSGYVIDINLPNFLGGREEGGGIVGRFRFFGGNSTQQVPDYVATYQSPASAYRWTSYILLENVEVGETPNIEAFSFEVERYPNPLALGAPNQISGDINPMSIIAECFSNGDWGFNRLSELNISNLATVAGVLSTEVNGMSLKWTNNATMSSIIEQVNKQIDGMLRYNPATGLWQYKLLRNDYTFGTLPIFNAANILEVVSFSRANWSETINNIQVNYNQRGIVGNPSPAVAQDQSNFKRQGRHKTLSLNFPGCYSATLAQNLASRELKTNGFPFSSADLVLDRNAWDLLPGDVFRLQYEDTLGITDLVMRVASIGFGDLEQSEIQVGAIEDVFALATNVFAAPPVTLYTSVNPAPVAITTRFARDQDYFLALRDSARVSLDTEKPLLMAAAPQGNALNWALETRQGSDPYVREGLVAYNPTGTLQSAITPPTGSVSAGVEIGTLIIENMINPQLLTNVSVNDDSIRIDGENLMVVVSTLTNPFTAAVYEPEIMAFDSVSVSGTTVTLTGVHRALSDTLSAGFNAGDRVWFLTGQELDGPGTTDLEYGNAESVDIRYINIATTGEASAASSTVALRDRASSPWSPRDYQVESIRYPTATFALNTAFTLNWKHNDRTFSGGTGTNGELYWQDQTTGAPSALEAGFEYVLLIYDDLSNTLRRRIRPSGSLNTPAGDDTLTTAVSFEYSLAKQQADGGPYGRYRSELWVEESVTGAAVVRSLLTVYRTWTVVVPVNFNRRGPYFYPGINGAAGAIYPLTQEALNFNAAIPSADVSTVRGTGAGAKVPTPVPISQGLYIPGRNGSVAADWRGNIEFPTSSEHQHSTATNEHFVSFWFKVVRDGQTLNRILITRNASGDTATQQLNNWRVYLDSNGRIKFHVYTSITQLADSLTADIRFDDGRWHHFMHFVTVDPGRAKKILVDGGSYDIVTSVSTVPSAQTTVLSIGGPDGVEAWSSTYVGTVGAGWAHGAITHILTDDIADVTTRWTGVLQQLFDGAPRTPFQTSAFRRFKDGWVRGNFWKSANGFGLTDWSENLNGTNESGMSLTVTNFQGASFKRAIYHNQGSGSGATNAILGPLLDGSLSYADDVDGDSSLNNSIFFAAEHWNGNAYLSNNNMQLFSFSTLLFSASAGARNLSTHDLILFHLDDSIDFGPEVVRGEIYAFWVDINNRINIGIQNQTGRYTAHRTADNAFVEDAWQMVTLTNDGVGNGWHVYVNGVEWALTYAYATAGTAPANSTFLNDRAPTSGVGSMLQSSFGAIVSTTRFPLVRTLDDCSHLVSEWGAEMNAAWSEDEVIMLFASMWGPHTNQYFKDAILDYNPENVFQVLEGVTIDDLRGNIITPTVTGTLTTDEHLPLPAHDTEACQRLTGTQRYDYTSDHLLSSRGTGAFDNFALVLVAHNMVPGANATFFSNGNVGASDEQMRFRHSTGAEVRFFQTGMSADVIGLQPADYSPFCYVMTHEDDAGTDRWNWFADGKKAKAEATTPANAYTGGVIDRFRIGDSSATGQFFDGALNYIAAYARTITKDHARRITLAYRGFHSWMLEVHKFIDGNNSLTALGFIYPLDERDMAASQAENWVINDTNLGNLSANGTPTHNKGGMVRDLWKYVSLVSGDYLAGPSPNFVSSPNEFTISAVVRVDSGTQAWVQATLTGNSENHIAIGINNGFAQMEYDQTSEGSGPFTLTGSIAIAVGEWAIITYVTNGAADHRLYVNGVLDASNSVSYGQQATLLGTNIDTIEVNSKGGTRTYNGSYQALWGVQRALTTEEVRVIHSAHRQNAWQQLTNRDVPVAQWLLDEPTAMVTDVFRDRYNNDYNAVPVSTGVTQGASGILPNVRGLCVDLDGANGGIDTNWLGYQTGSGLRAFECWIEGGFVGTVFSMGANTDANALVVSVDGSGDLSIHIRGAGNERIWTTAIDVGVEHHLLVQLPTAGDSLHDFEVWLNGVEETTIGTAGTDTVLATTATLDFWIGDDVTDIGKADGTGRIYGVTAYNAPIAAPDITLRSKAGRALDRGDSW